MLLITASPDGPLYSIMDRNGRIVADRLTLDAVKSAAPALGLDSLDAGSRELMMVTDNN
jgi:hypothetical protein